MMTKRQKFGLRGELWAKDQLEALGYDVRLISDFFNCYDLIIDDFLPVEVKISRQRRRYIRPGYHRPNYSFDVSRIPQDQDSVVILICQDETQALWPYIMPSWFVVDKTRVNITSHPTVFSGRYAGYCHLWCVVDEVKLLRARLGQMLQLPLFV